MVRRLLSFLCCTSLLSAQGTWAAIPGDPAPPRWAQGRMAFDRARNCTVMVNGSDVWEGRGTTWRFAASVPNTAGYGGGFAYDGTRQRCLWFGGAFFGSQFLEWTGTTWQNVVTAHAPAPRQDTAMAYDEHRGRMVLFGGWAIPAYPADTWEFDGVDWRQVAPAVSPPGTSRHLMTYDSARREIVLYSPTAGYGAWLYDGVTWRATPPGPPALGAPAMVYDEARGRTVLASSSNFTVPRTSTWEWDGVAWSNPQPNGPQLGFAVNGAYDTGRGVVELVAGLGDGLSTWRWTGATWERGTPFGSLPATAGIAVGYHAPTATPIAFGAASGYGATGASNDTFAYQRGGWRLLDPAVRPGLRGYAALAPEPSGDLLLFGGIASAVLAESWRWNGSTWTQLAPTVSPPPRCRHGMAADLGRGRVVLFGGQDTLGSLFGDTWEWDGVTWNPQPATPAPSARVYPAMTYDPLRARTLLFGGGTTTSATDELWQWDGTTWSATPLATRPAPRNGATFTFDPQGGVAVLAGGFVYHFLGANVPVTDGWQWNGTQWTPIAGSAPAYDVNAVGVYHQELGSTLYSVPMGLIQSRQAVDYEYAFGSVAAATAFGTGCPGAAGVPLLSAIGVPRAGNRRFGIWLSNAHGGAFTVLGFDWQTASIPFGGCTVLLPTPVFLGAFADPFGNVMVPLPLPADPALHGLVLHVQATSLDPAGALFGMAALTAGLRLVLS